MQRVVKESGPLLDFETSARAGERPLWVLPQAASRMKQIALLHRFTREAL